MQITFDTNNLSVQDQALLGLILADAVADADAAAGPTAKASTPAKTAATTPAKVAEPTPEPVVEPAPEPEEDLLGGGPTLDDAVAQAQVLLGNGGASKIKAALTAIGVKKVGELKGDQIATFIDTISAG